MVKFNLPWEDLYFTSSTKLFKLNKNRFKQVVKEFHNLSSEDREKLHELVKTFPYSQVIHTLVAKANNDAATDIAKQSLNYAAMYTTDRALLKDIVESKASVTEAQAETQTAHLEKQGQKESHESPASSSQSGRVTVNESSLTSTSDDLTKQVWEDLEALKKSKEHYLESTSNIPEKPPVKKKSTTPKKTTTAKKQPSATSGSKPPARSKSVTKTKASTKTTNTTKPRQKTTSGKKESVSGSKKVVSSSDDTGSTALSADQKKKSSTKKRRGTPKTQQEIIEQFIDKEPSISTKKAPDATTFQEDLSKTSTSFGENLISENLAQILVAQGKKKKAIDIYKKLIWKFPQKKSYFAGLIEDLQK